MKTTVTLQAQKMEKFWQKSFGLLLSKPKIIYFETRWGIHTFGMKYTIDVIVLNENNQAVIIKTLKPNRIFLWNPMYKKILELPSPTSKKLHITLGTNIIMTP